MKSWNVTVFVAEKSIHKIKNCFEKKAQSLKSGSHYQYVRMNVKKEGEKEVAAEKIVPLAEYIDN